MDEFRKRMGMKPLNITDKDRKYAKKHLTSKPMIASKKKTKAKLEFRALTGDTSAKDALKKKMK